MAGMKASGDLSLDFWGGSPLSSDGTFIGPGPHPDSKVAIGLAKDFDCSRT